MTDDDRHVFSFPFRSRFLSFFFSFFLSFFLSALLLHPEKGRVSNELLTLFKTTISCIALLIMFTVFQLNLLVGIC